MNKAPSRDKALNQYLDPYPNFGRLRNVGRVVRIRTAFNGQGWLITQHEDAQALAGDPRLSVEARNACPELGPLLSRPGFRFFDYLTDSMIVMDPPEHTRLRRLVSKEFTPRRVAVLAPYIRAFVQEKTAALSRDAPVDLVEELTALLPAAVICRWMGLQDEDSATIRSIVSTNSLLPVDAEVTSQHEQARQDMLDCLGRIIERKRQHPEDDLVSVLIGACDQGDSLSDGELISMLATLIGGGTDAPAQMLGSAVLLLLRHPDQMARLIDDPTLIPSAVEELLRFESPVTLGLIRFALEDITVGDVTIPKGDLVFVGVSSAN
ncbi:MAG: cytochrome P450, partial [Frankia sp.]